MFHDHPHSTTMDYFDEQHPISLMHRSPDPHTEPNSNPNPEDTSITINITPRTRDQLDLLKNNPDESYDSVISRLCDRAINDEPLSKETLQEIEKSLVELRKGIYHTHAEIVQELVAGKKE